MKLKDNTIISIGMMSLTFGILIGRFTYLEYSDFSISDFAEGILDRSLFSDESFLFNYKIKEIEY